MSARQLCPPVPGPLEAFAAQFDDLFARVSQRLGFRQYLQGLLLPRDRNKTLTALVGAEPIVQAQAAAVQRLQWFLSEATWDAEAVNRRRLELLLADPATAPTADGVLVIDDTGDRKDGTHTDHVGRQYLGSVGKIDNGVVVVTSLWANEDRYYPLHLAPYTPAKRLAQGKADPAFRTKPEIAHDLLAEAQAAGVPFRAVVADSFYGDNGEFEAALRAAEAPYVLAVKPSKAHWAPAEAVHTPQEAAEALRWYGVDEPGDWTAISRVFHDDHLAGWWAAELVFGPYGPDRARRVVVITTDPATLPPLSTWYLLTNLPAPGSERAAASPIPSADLAELTRLYGFRNWVEQGYKQQKDELGWADYQVRRDRAMRRHWQLVVCAFTFCWDAWFHPPAQSPSEWGGKSRDRPAGARPATPLLASGAARGSALAGPLVAPPAALGSARGEDEPTDAPGRAAPLRSRRARATNLPLSPPIATNYR
ncbi:MAG: IS701 family transposase [Dehalococcoidia bacterium]